MPKIKAAVLHGILDLRLEDWDLPEEPPPGSARIRMKSVGICGSDCHYWTLGRIAHFKVEKPMVIGHESAGIVIALGKGITQLKVGDKVALEGGVPSPFSRFSLEGRYNIDPDLTFFATPPVHGSLADQVDHPADFCHVLPEAMSTEEGALIEPLSVGVHACRRTDVKPGTRVAIMGAGPIGLVSLMAAKAFGADLVAITDLEQPRLELATELGADAVYRNDPNDDAKMTATHLKLSAGIHDSDGFDVVIDCAGFEATMRTAINAARSGAKIALVGMGQAEMNLPMGEASIKEIDILGSFRYANTYPTCISLISSGRVPVKKLISHRFPFNMQGLSEGFTTARDEPNAIKVMFDL